MTNVINTTSNSVLTSNVHTTNITQQSDDLLPSLASLSFNVTNSGETSVGSVTSISGTTGTTLNVGVHSTEDTNETTLSTLLSPILNNNNTVDAKDFKTIENNLELQQNITTADMLTVLTAQQTTNNVAAVSPSMSSSSSQAPINSQYDFATTKINDDNTSVAAMWSNIDDGSNHNIGSNGFKSNSNYPNSLVTTLMNNTNLSANLQQQNRRAITASHGGYQQQQQQGLPPNNLQPRGMPSIQQHANHHNLHKPNQPEHQSHHMNMQQSHHLHQQNLNYHQTPNAIDRDQMHESHRHQQKPNLYNSSYPVWSNPSSTMPWQTQQQQSTMNNSIPVN